MTNYKFNVTLNEGGSLKLNTYEKQLDFLGFRNEMQQINRLNNLVEAVAMLNGVQVSYISKTF